MTQLSELVQGGASQQAIATYLNCLPFAACKAEVHALGRLEQKRLYERADPAMSLSDLIPDDSELEPVHHHGRNSQPMFRDFQKRFTRQPDGTVVGYNEGSLRPVIGPGYFVARETGGDDRGHVVVDYFMTPESPTPNSWPNIVASTDGLQKYIYAYCRDYMRKVSDHVSIGKAIKREKTALGYFVLVREY